MKLNSALRNPHLWPWLIILLGAILRAWHLGSSPLWYDEAFTAVLSRLPIYQMLNAIAGDVHPPLYYLVTWSVVHLVGSSPAVLRAPSVFFSILSLVSFHQLTADLRLSNRARLVSLAVMTLLPFNLYYAQEARMYAMLQWLIIMQFRAVINRRWMEFEIFTVLSLYTHNYAIFYTAILALIALGRELVRPVPRLQSGVDTLLTTTDIISLALSLLLAMVTWLPWSAVLYRQMGTISGNYWIPSLSLGSILQALYMAFAGNVPEPFIPITALCLFIGLLLLGLAGLRKPRHLGLVTLAFGPFALAVVISIIWQPVILYRGLIGMAAPLSILAGIALASTTRRGGMVGMALFAPFVVGLVWLFGAGEVGMGKFTQYLPAFTAGLPVVHLDDSTLIMSQDTSAFLLDGGCPEEAGSLSQATRQAIGIKSISRSELPDQYIFAARLFPLSTACHAAIVAEISAGAEVIGMQESELTMLGVWYAADR